MQHELALFRLLRLVIKIFPRKWKMADTNFIWNVAKRVENIRCAVRSTSYQPQSNFLTLVAEMFKFSYMLWKWASFRSIRWWSSALLHCAEAIEKWKHHSFNVLCYCTLILYIDPIRDQRMDDWFESWYNIRSIYRSSVHSKIMSALPSFMPLNCSLSFIEILLPTLYYWITIGAFT